jgi:nucleotide-binding universal stress UspA family protein
MRMLVPLDGTLHAEFALGPAAQIASHTVPHAEITLLHVVPSPHGTQANTARDYVLDLDAAMAESGAYLRAIGLRPSLAHLPVRYASRVAEGGVAATISAVAQERQIDLIAMSSKGYTPPTAYDLASMAEQVVALTAIPTVILHMEDTFHTLYDSYRPFTVVVALDGSLAAEAALAPATTIARAMHGMVRLACVLPEHTHEADEERLLWDAAERYLHAVQRRLQCQGVPTEMRVTWGDPACEFARTARSERQRCDLLAIAAHRSSGGIPSEMGEVVTAMLHAAPCPLLILRSAR